MKSKFFSRMRKVSKAFLAIRVRMRYLVVLGYIALIAGYLLIAAIDNSLANLGQRITIMEEIKNKYQTDNMVLEDKIASYSALRYIEPTAKRLGFTPIKEVRWLNK